MDDLLSVALSESGLDEFLTPLATPTEGSAFGFTPDSSVDHTDLPPQQRAVSIDHQYDDGVSNQSTASAPPGAPVTFDHQPQCVSPDVEQKPAPVARVVTRPTSLKPVQVVPPPNGHDYQSGSSASHQPAPMYERRMSAPVAGPSSSSGVPVQGQTVLVRTANGTLERRTVGPGGFLRNSNGQLVKTITRQQVTVDADGNKVYRTVRGVPATGIKTQVTPGQPGTRVVVSRPGTPSQENGRQIVVLNRQGGAQTPTTGQMVMRAGGGGVGVQRGTTVVRRIRGTAPLMRGSLASGGRLVQRVGPNGQPMFYQQRMGGASAPNSPNVPVAHSHVHTETGHQYVASHSPPGAPAAPSPSGARIIRQGPGVARGMPQNVVRVGTPGGYRAGVSTGYMSQPQSPNPNSPSGRGTFSQRGAAQFVRGRGATAGRPMARQYNTSYGASQVPQYVMSTEPAIYGDVYGADDKSNVRRVRGGADVQQRGPGRPPLQQSEPVPFFEQSRGKMSSPSPIFNNKAAVAKKAAKDEMKAAMQAASEKASGREIDEDEENLGHAETYAEYRPAKLRSGLSHPDCVVETASLSSVAPPDIRYNITIPEYLIDTGAVSALQLEAVIYACQKHEERLPSGERTGYLIGDGAGVGKGRTVACIIFENYLLDRKRALWLSVSSDLKFDAERDLRDIGAGNIQVYQLNKMKYAKISGKENGNIKKGVMFATYSSLIGECRSAKSKYRSRLKQLIQWLGPDFDGCIIFDECHRAKNLVPTTGAKPTKTGKMVLELQKALPNARVVYASATGATEPRNMAYMTRLGLWGPGQAFPDFSDFINAVERRGVGAMEIVAMDMKQRGLYLARQLSFRGVSFRVEEIQLSADFVKAYDESVKLWMECRRQFQLVLSQMSEEERGSCKQVWGQFWACHQRFFKYLCIGAKVEACVAMTRDAIKNNKCVVIGLQSTGEARTLETLEDMGGELNEFVSTAKAVLQGLIEKHFPSGDGAGTDIFRDFDKMFNDFDRPKRRKNTRGHGGMDVLEMLGLGPSTERLTGPAAKRARRTSGGSNSTTSSSGGEDDDDGTGLSPGEDSESDSEGEVCLGDNEEDWRKALLAEIASSSSEDDSGDGKDNSDEESDAEGAAEGMKSCGEEEFNPFACDFSQDDPWAGKQQLVEDSPKKKKRELTEEQKAAAEARRKSRRKKRKRQRKREQDRETARQKRKEVNSEAMKSTATQFITSSRLIDDNGDTINPQMIKAELLAAVERLGPQLPNNTLDQLIDELGGPEFVAEMTGRKGRVVTKDDGEVTYELRHTGADVPLEMMNMDEKDKFMKAEKMIAVISEAASSGISLQSDRRAPNKRRRVHITLELPWSADKAIQQFGRTHRSNQVSAPEYVFLISELAGEKRFASIVAKRLESLGALTHGDRRATESRDLSQFNLDTKYGRAALDVLLRSVIGTLNPPLIPPPDHYQPGNFFEDMRLYMEGVGLVTYVNKQWVIEREAATIAKFLNRILGLPVHAQNALFHYFTDILNELIAQAKHDGTYDMGIMDLGTGGDQVRKLETRVFLGRVEKGSFRVEMHKIGVERGVSWEDAYAIWQEHNTNEDGFYISSSNAGINGKKVAALVYGIGKKRLDTGARLYAVTRPSTGRSAKLETFTELSKRFEKTDPETAKRIWMEQYEGSSKMCQHSYIHNRCKNEAAGTYCEVGRRTRTYFVLAGSVLSVWPVVESCLSVGGRDKRASRMQVIRVRTDQDQKIVGLLVLPHYVRTLVAQLEENCGRCIVEHQKKEIKPEIKTEVKTEIKTETK